jgi:hypothetical protein
VHYSALIEGVRDAALVVIPVPITVFAAHVYVGFLGVITCIRAWSSKVATGKISYVPMISGLHQVLRFFSGFR